MFDTVDVVIIYLMAIELWLSLVTLLIAFLYTVFVVFNWTTALEVSFPGTLFISSAMLTTLLLANAYFGGYVPYEQADLVRAVSAIYAFFVYFCGAICLKVIQYKVTLKHEEARAEIARLKALVGE